ncbi:MAG: tetratricopeptide repeat protein, partial [Bryobacteraceae bacterium]
MGTAFAGIVRVPLTSVIMVFEITRDYSIIVPLMISNLVSFAISYKFQREPIYEALLHQEGIHLPEAARGRGTTLVVRNAMRPAPRSVSIADRLSSIPLGRGDVPVVDAEGLAGVLREARLEQALKDGWGDRPVSDLLPQFDPQAKLTAANFPHVHPDHPLDTALQRMAEHRLKVLPVVRRTNLREVLGVVSLDDILNAYGIGKQQAQISTPSSAHETSRPGALLAVLIAATAGVGLFAGFGTYYYRSGRVEKAADSYRRARELSAQERHPEAIEQYRKALSISHSDQYRLALASELVTVGRFNEAAIYLNDFLRAHPDSGPANLGMARVAASRGSSREAAHFYRRGTYGDWPSGAEEDRVRARFEFVDYLRRTGGRQQAITELLALTEQTSTDAAVKMRVGQRLLALDASREAAGLFQDVIRENPDNAAAYLGLGEAEFQRERYQAARAGFEAALSRSPKDQKAQQKLHVTEQILALDPTARRLRPVERYQRSRSLVSLALVSLEACQPAATDDEKALADRIRKTLTTKRQPASWNDATENNVALAQDLWTLRERSCTAGPAPDEALARVMSLLSR